MIKNTDIAEELALPPVKIHCSVLAEDAISAAIEDYKSKKNNIAIIIYFNNMYTSNLHRVNKHGNTPKTMCTNIGGMERMLRVIAGIAILYMGPGLI